MQIGAMIGNIYVLCRLHIVNFYLLDYLFALFNHATHSSSNSDETRVDS